MLRSSRGVIRLVLAASDQGGENASKRMLADPVHQDIASKACFMRFSINVKLQRPIGKFLQLNSYDGII
jgi:hypothetical protein